MGSTFSQVVGNDALKKRLAADIRKATLAHAYIIEGRKGCGKHTLARAIAAAINCKETLHGGNNIPCGVCEACRKIFAGISTDVITVTRESGKATLGVDVIRALRADVSTVPAELEKKVYLIEDADTMTAQAQNALLLTLEEPPPFVTFFLLCENSRSLLETIRSRAPALRVQPLSRDEVDAYLTENDPRARLAKNNQADEYEAILTAADGAIGEAARLLDPKERKAFLNARAAVESIVDACMDHRSSGELIALLSAFPQKRQEAIEAFALLLTAVRDLLALNRADHPHLCFYVDLESAADKSSRFSLSALVSLFRAAENAMDALARNASVQLTYTSFAVSVGR